MNWISAGMALPPPGRTRVTWQEAQSLLVDDQRFAASATRARLWQGLERYIARFALLERVYEADLDDQPLVHYLWLGGSFVSTKLDPQNIDLTVAVDAVGRKRLKGRVGSGWLNDAFQRDACLREFGVAALELPYRRVASVFRSHKIDADDQGYLRERGAWDDWWQRCRMSGVGNAQPSEETAVAVRGYLEVTL